jgi:hypothetical protein
MRDRTKFVGSWLYWGSAVLAGIVFYLCVFAATIAFVRWLA